MNPKLPIDELFRKKLSNHEVSPSDSLWENILMARAKKSKPTPKAWPIWLVSSIVLISFAILSKEILKDNNTNKAQITLTKSTKANLQGNIAINDLNPLTDAKKPFATNNDLTENQLRNSPVFISHSPEIPSESGLTPHIEKPLTIPEKIFEITEESSFESFSTISTLEASLPHELSLYSEYLPVPFKKKLWFAKIDFLLSQDYIHNSLEAKSSLFEPYATLRNESENLKISNSFMLRMGISTIKGWGLRSGIQYSRMQQSLTLLVPDATNKKEIKNIFETIDIPLVITKEQSFGKIRAGLSLGTYLNMAFNQRGSFYSPTSTLIEFTSSKPGAYPAFKNRLGASVYGGLSLSFPVGNSLEFIAEPYIRSRIPSISVDDYVLDQKIWIGGIFIGLRRQIGKGFYLP